MSFRSLPGWTLLLLLFAAPVAQAQDGPGLGARRDTFVLSAGPTFQLRAPVVPGTEALFVLRGQQVLGRLPPSDYTLDAATGALAVHLDTTAYPPPVAPTPDSRAVPDSLAPADTLGPAPPPLRLAVAYRVLDLGLQAEYARRRFVQEEDTVGLMRDISLDLPQTRSADPDPLFGDVRLRRSGSITRGLIAGSNRDLSVESGLRMELAGAVAEGVNVQAVLTDENTPIQPEGTTQQLSDFDRVFVQLDAPMGRARLGDVDLAVTGSEFASFTRKIQGAALEGNVPAWGAFAGGRLRAAGATTRGIFQSQDLPAIEGVQGPYRLRGRQGEEFVIVIAGSERVYLDGILLTRGENGDYVIDYATGELTFTPRRLITAERRITVDFEYTTSRFTRTLLVGEAEAGFLPRAERPPRARIGVAVLREADAASFGAELGLSEADLDSIAVAGDRDVLIPGEERVAFDPESPFVLYARRDTLFSGQTYAIFVPATAADTAVYRVRFTRVSAGRGSYRRGGQARNGILYEWVGPTGGDYIPFRLLPKPALRQLVDVTASAELLPGLEAFAEAAGSTNDLNTLSGLGSDDDDGTAFVGGLRLQNFQLGRLGALHGQLRHRRQADSFVGFDRTRPVEFNRQWNLARSGTTFGTGLDSLAEATTEGALRWALTARTSAAIEGGMLDLGGVLRADRQAVELRVDEPRLLGGWLPAMEWRLDRAGSRNALAGEEGTFLRQRALVRRALLGGRLTPSVGFEQERRAQERGGLDSLSAASFAFVAVRPGLAWQSVALAASLTVERRREEEPLSGALVHSADATTFEGEVRYTPGPEAATEARVAYRLRDVTEPFRLLGREASESLALRWTGRVSPFRRAVEASTLYEALTERTPLLQETYILVGPELGEFVWRDGEGEPRPGEPDGIAQVDEFFPETFSLEGEYARTFVPSDELFPTIGVEAQLRLRTEPGRLFEDRADRRWLARVARALAGQTTVEVRERSTDPALWAVLLLQPGHLQQRDSILVDGELLPPPTINGRFRLSQELSLFPGQPRYGGRLTLSHLTSTGRLAAGQEVRLLQTARAEANAAPHRRVALRLIGLAERNRAESEGFVSRTFDIRSLGLEPQATVTVLQGLSATLGVVASDKGNRLAQEGQPTGARVLRIPVEVRWAAVRRLALTLRAERADVDVRGGTAAGLASFELTEGRGPGVSYLWGVTGQYTLNRFLRATLFYDARAPADAPTIHTVRMQLSAVF